MHRIGNHEIPTSMGKSEAVPLTLLAAVSALLTGCQNQPRHCVDAQGRIVTDSNCSPGTAGFHYVYGGSSGGHIGDTVVGGSVSRGGFGWHGNGGAGGE